eukprot:gnl/TRDRNA2_/TRDRNA2_181490_c0_seq1.p1 gnl/TRDRNA2_/TRDRNA2_181490_c0~~gnl/TRDRNA2_/TRDRNA2_181490_c0_seq1.p1  ORF type:complete len:392 (+),score=30.22 gnl/TRDRNA2_/TRDRNA2_181490_c0_seq1:74-1249(+)
MSSAVVPMHGYASVPSSGYHSPMPISRSNAVSLLVGSPAASRACCLTTPRTSERYHSAGATPARRVMRVASELTPTPVSAPEHSGGNRCLSPPKLVCTMKAPRQNIPARRISAPASYTAVWTSRVHGRALSGSTDAPKEMATDVCAMPVCNVNLTKDLEAREREHLEELHEVRERCRRLEEAVSDKVVELQGALCKANKRALAAEGREADLRKAVQDAYRLIALAIGPMKTGGNLTAAGAEQQNVPWSHLADGAFGDTEVQAWGRPVQSQAGHEAVLARLPSAPATLRKPVGTPPTHPRDFDERMLPVLSTPPKGKRHTNGTPGCPPSSPDAMPGSRTPEETAPGSCGGDKSQCSPSSAVCSPEGIVTLLQPVPHLPDCTDTVRPRYGGNL